MIMYFFFNLITTYMECLISRYENVIAKSEFSNLVSIDDSGRMVTGINKNKLYANIVYTNRCSISHFHTKYYNQALTYLCPVTCAKFNVVIKHLTIYISRMFYFLIFSNIYQP